MIQHGAPFCPGIQTDEELPVQCLAERERETAMISSTTRRRLLELPRAIDRIACAVAREAALEPGVPAQIVSGPIAGLRGRVLTTRRGGLRLVMHARIIRQEPSDRPDS